MFIFINNLLKISSFVYVFFIINELLDNQYKLLFTFKINFYSVRIILLTIYILIGDFTFLRGYLDEQ